MISIEKAILRLMKAVDITQRVSHMNVIKVLDKSMLDVLLQENFLKKEIIPPRVCPVCQSLQISIRNREEAGFFEVICEKKHFQKIPIESRTYYSFNFEKFINLICKKLSITQNEIIKTVPFIFQNSKIDNISIHVIATFNNISSKNLAMTISHIALSTRIPILVLVSDKLYSMLGEYLSMLIGGQMVLVVPYFLVFSNTKTLKDYLYNWLKYTRGIMDIENKIVSKIKDKDLLRLVLNINLNPTYLITLLNNLYILKMSNIKNFDWALLENTIAIAFQSLFTTKVGIGGKSSTGEAFPDNFFVITDEKKGIHIVGIVDCKSSQKFNPTQDKTEKYVHYLEAARKNPSFVDKKHVLIFVVFKAHEKGILNLYYRLEDRLSDNEYVLVLPVDALELLVRIALNIIVRNEIALYNKQFYEISINFFDNKSLREIKNKYPNLLSEKYKVAGKLFILTPEIIVEEFKKIFEGIRYIDVLIDEYYAELKH